MDCLDPPVDEAPNGNWICPNCEAWPHPPPVAIPPPFPFDPLSEPRATTKRVRKPKDVKGKGRARGASTMEDVSSPARHVHVASSPEIPAPGRRKVRLVVRKPKAVSDVEEEEEEEPSSPAHMFADILTPEQYSAANTHILDSDRVLFNKAKTRAEVCPFLNVTSPMLTIGTEQTRTTHRPSTPFWPHDPSSDPFHPRALSRPFFLRPRFFPLSPQPTCLNPSSRRHTHHTYPQRLWPNDDHRPSATNTHDPIWRV